MNPIVLLIAKIVFIGIVIIVTVNTLVGLFPAIVIGWLIMMAVNKNLESKGSKTLEAIHLMKNARNKNWHSVGAIVGFVTVGAVILSQLTVFATAVDYFENGEIINGIILVLAIALGACIDVVIYKTLIKLPFFDDLFTKAMNQSLGAGFSLSSSENSAVTRPNLEMGNIDEYCKTQVYGQDSLIDKLVMTIVRRTRLARKNKPLGAFLFVGPTGVGKTELSKALADSAFEGRMIRFDMGEFTAAESVARLVGAPPGYAGSESGGQLSQAIWSLGSGVILFDEIEKAHENVKKLMLALVDEGRFTEASSGNTADASNFIIIMTSNASHQELGEIAEKYQDQDDLRRAIKDTLNQSFAPEMLARIDEVFCFKKLDRKSTAKVVLKQLKKLEKDTGVEIIEYDSELLINAVMRHEKQDTYGIRELLRLIDNNLADPMLDVRDMGYQKAYIEVVAGNITVRGVNEKSFKERGQLAALES